MAWTSVIHHRRVISIGASWWPVASDLCRLATRSRRPSPRLTWNARISLTLKVPPPPFLFFIFLCVCEPHATRRGKKEEMANTATAFPPFLFFAHCAVYQLCVWLSESFCESGVVFYYIIFENFFFSLVMLSCEKATKITIQSDGVLEMFF